MPGLYDWDDNHIRWRYGAVMFIVLLPLAVLFATCCFYHIKKAYTLAYDLSHPRINRFSLNFDCKVTQNVFEAITDDGITIKCIDVVPQAEIKGTIFVCHNLGGCKEMAISYISFLLKRGFRLIAMDFRNHGESGLDKNLNFCYDKDFKAVVDAAKANGIMGPYGAVGFSIGSNVTLAGLSQFPEIKAAVIDSGPLIYAKDYFNYVLDEKKVKNPLVRLSFLTIFLNFAGFNRLADNTFKYLKNRKGMPIIFIHGEKDHIIDIKNAEVAYKQVCSQRSEFWRIPNSRHLTNYFLARDMYQNKLVNFFDNQF